MNDIIIIVKSKNGNAYTNNDTLGNQYQNLQNKLKFEFIDEVVDGTGWLEYEIDGVKKYALMEKYEKGYQIDIKSCLLISDHVDVDIKITQDENPEGIPVFISTIVQLKVARTINAEEEEPEEYPNWFENAIKITDEASNLDLDVSKSGNTSTITITKKDGTQKSVEVYDGTDETGNNGATFTPSVSEEGIISWTNDKGLVNPTPINIKGPQGADGKDGEPGDKGEKGDPFTYEDFTAEQLAGLVGPKGDPGTDGTNGTDGKDGLNGTNGVDGKDGITPTIGENGNWFLGDIDTGKPSRGETGPQGEPGINGTNGIDGQSATITIGTVTTGDAGTSASVVNSGTSTNAVFDFVIPKGDSGSLTDEDKENIKQEVAGDLLTNINDTRDELEILKNDILETGEDSDTYILLEDSTMAEYQELRIDGAYKQATTTGKNLSPQNSATTTSSGYLNYSSGTFGYVEADKTYTLSMQINKQSADTNYIQIRCYTAETGGTNQGNVATFNLPAASSRKSTTFTSSYTGYLVISAGPLSEVSYEIFTEIQLEEGSTATEYEPYTGGIASPNPGYPQEISVVEDSLKITSCGKNLFDGEMEAGGYYLNTGLKNDVDAATIIRNVNPIYIKPNTTYIFSNDGIGIAMNVLEYDVDGNFIGWLTGAAIPANSSFTTSSNAHYINICRETSITINEIQMEKGTTITEYEEYISSQIQANIPEGEFIGKINDTYKDELKVEYNEEDGNYHLKLYKNVGKIVLDGSESWVFQTANTNFFVIKMFFSYANTAYVSTHFIYNSSGDNRIVLGVDSIDGVSGKVMYVRILNENVGIENSDSNSVRKEKMVAWLASNNVAVYYALTTPYVLDLCVVDMPLTYNEITNLFTDSDLMPTINAKYYRNFTETVRNLQINNDTLKNELISINDRLTALEAAQAAAISEGEVAE